MYICQSVLCKSNIKCYLLPHSSLFVWKQLEVCLRGLPARHSMVLSGETHTWKKDGPPDSHMQYGSNLVLFFHSKSSDFDLFTHCMFQVLVLKTKPWTLVLKLLMCFLWMILPKYFSFLQTSRGQDVSAHRRFWRFCIQLRAQCMVVCPNANHIYTCMNVNWKQFALFILTLQAFTIIYDVPDNMIRSIFCFLSWQS